MTDRRTLAGVALAFACLFAGCDGAASVAFQDLGLVSPPVEGLEFCCDGSEESQPVVLEVEANPPARLFEVTTMGLTIENVSPAGALRFLVDGIPFDPEVDGFEFTDTATVEIEVVVVACTIELAEFDIRLTEFAVEGLGLLRPLQTATERQTLVSNCPEPPGGGTTAALTIEFAGEGEGQVAASWTSGGSRTITATTVLQIPVGDSVTMDATADPGSVFSHWTGPDDIAGQAAFVSGLTGDRTVSVFFEVN